MADENLKSYIYEGREERNLEYKESMNWQEERIKMKLIKTCLAMANLRDGGQIVLGVEEPNKNEWIAVGMKDADYNSFNQDDISRKVNNYADPSIEITLYKIIIENKKFIVIRVKPFEDIPIICKDDGIDLNAGKIYVRPKSMIECVAVPNAGEMREILDIAIDNQITKLIQKCNKYKNDNNLVNDSKAKYDEDLKDLL